jgi:hypothetical protein
MGEDLGVPLFPTPLKKGKKNKRIQILDISRANIWFLLSILTLGSCAEVATGVTSTHFA